MSLKPAKKKLSGIVNSNLPIHAYRDQLIDSVSKYATTIVVGETGSGKSTQLPQFLVQSGRWKSVVCTQPRRVAAVTVAKRVAEEYGCEVGKEVGYSIRFEDCTSSITKIKFATDGVLLRELMSDPNLARYNVVILDEAHERSLQTDILMGLLRQLQDRRQDLKIIIMSATLDTEMFANFFQSPNILTIPGRQFPVEVFYLKKEEKDVVEAIMLTCLQIHMDEADNGGVLVFLPGQDDIEALQHLLTEHLPNVVSKLKPPVGSVTTTAPGGGPVSGPGSDNKTNSLPLKQVVLGGGPASSDETSALATKTVDMMANDFEIRPLYAAMPPEDQLKVFADVPKHVRKFILATNIAETSVTVTGVKYIVDCGFAKTRLIHPVTGFEMLKTVCISKAQANQRAGRAGRTGPGKCYRIYEEKAFLKFDDVTLPEIQRVNMTQVVLQLKDLGIANIMEFPLPSPPTKASVRQAFQVLLMLQALDKQQGLTPHGKNMAQLPLFPQLSHLLLKSVEHGCVSEALTAVSLLSSESVFQQPFEEEAKAKAERAKRNFSTKEGDLLTLVNVYEKWKEARMDKNWAGRNFLNQRALQHANSVRNQLTVLLRTKLQFDTSLSCLPKKEPFLKCLAAGLFMNVARKVTVEDGAVGTSDEATAHQPLSQSEIQRKTVQDFVLNKNNSAKISKFRSQASNPLLASNGAAYKTIRGGEFVHVHPSSVLFTLPGGIKKLPNYIIFAELLITSKQYVRTLSVIDESWLPLVAPHMYGHANGSSAGSADAPPAGAQKRGAGEAGQAVSKHMRT
jgi:HrpA-like RNA helicase